MSRYRKTMREALEEVYASDFNEGKMKDVYTMQQSGATAREIADKMKLHTDNGGKLNEYLWEEDEPSYGSVAYCEAYGC